MTFFDPEGGDHMRRNHRKKLGKFERALRFSKLCLEVAILVAKLLTKF